MVWTSSLFDFCYPAAFGRIDHLALVSVTPSVWVPCCRSQSSVLLLVSLCAILLLYICCRWHGLYSGFHCPYNIDRIFSLSFRTSVFFLKIPQNRQGGQGIEGSLNPPLFSIRVMTDGCFHVAVAESSMLLCAASVSHQVAPHSPCKLKGKMFPCLSLVPISYLLR